MSEVGKVIIETYKPSGELVDELVQAAFDPQTLDMAYRFKIIEYNLQYARKPHVFSQLLKYFLSALSSEDPTHFHFDIARRALAIIDKDYLTNDQAVDMLARELVKSCNKLNKRMRVPECIAISKRDCEKLAQDRLGPEPACLSLNEFPEANAEFEEQFFSNGLSKWDEIYLKVLSSCGLTGRKQAKEQTKKLKQNEEGWDQAFWFRKSDADAGTRFFHSPAFLGLAGTLWDDVVKRRVTFAAREVPALTTSVHDPVVKILSPHNQVVARVDQVQLFHQDTLLGAYSIAAIPQNIIGPVFNGIKKLNTVTGHRLTRHLVQSAFTQIANGHSDHRVMKLDRGASEIAERLGLTGNRVLETIKEIIHAMAYFEFTGPILTGNLILLSKYTSPITGRQDEGWLVTVGPPLLPYQTFEAYKKGECGLLIPLLTDPPLVGANQFHGGQYLLQMEVMAEFSKQSALFAQEGAVEISEDRWGELANSCGLSKEILRKVHDRWTQDGDDGGQFLNEVGDGFYTLGTEYNKALEFLNRQGQIRIQNSNRGKFSVIKRSKAKKRK